MTLFKLFHFNKIILFFAFISSSSFAANYSIPEMSSPESRVLLARLNEISKEKDKIDKITADCSDTVGGVSKYCQDNTGKKVLIKNWQELVDRSNKLGTEIKDVQKKYEIQYANETAQQQKIKQEQLKIKQAENEKDFNKKWTDIESLLKQKSELDRDLKVTGLDVKMLYMKLDQTLLGAYAKYVAQEYAKSNDMKKQICETVSSCSAVKTANALKANVDALSKKIKSFEEFKKKYEEPQPSAAVQTPAVATPPPPTPPQAGP